MTGLYMVVKPMPCCGMAESLGLVLNIVRIEPLGNKRLGCPFCWRIPEPGEVMAISDNDRIGHFCRLTKLDGNAQDERNEAEILRHLNAVEARGKPKPTRLDTYHEHEEACGLAPY